MFVVAMTSLDEIQYFSKDNAPENDSLLYTGIAGNNQSMWIGWILEKNITM